MQVRRRVELVGANLPSAPRNTRRQIEQVVRSVRDSVCRDVRRKRESWTRSSFMANPFWPVALTARKDLLSALASTRPVTICRSPLAATAGTCWRVFGKRAGSAGGQTLCRGCDGTVTPVPKSLLLAVAALVLVPLATARSDRQTRAAATTIQVKGGEFFFKLSAKSIAKPGKVTFVFKNVGHVMHDFKINGKKTPLIQPGKDGQARRHVHEEEEVHVSLHRAGACCCGNEGRLHGSLTTRETLSGPR